MLSPMEKFVPGRDEPDEVAYKGRSYEPRVTFQLKSISDYQRQQLRSVLFILRLLEARVRAEGSIRKAAAAMGVSKAFLSEVLRGKKPPGYHLAHCVGYVPKVVYMRADATSGGNGAPAVRFPEHLTGPKAGIQNGTTRADREAREVHRAEADE